jgi:tyrosyl-tRNA synthetase
LREHPRASSKEGVHQVEAQAVLARELTRLVHGEEGLAAAERISDSLFSGLIEGLSEDDVLQLRQDGLPASTLRNPSSSSNRMSRR